MGGDFRVVHEELRRVLRRLWMGVREWCGDAAYERYLQSRGRRCDGSPPLSRDEFYVSQLQRKYSRVSRCC